MLLEITNLRTAYGDVEALHGINLKVDEGRIVTLVGANAAGKSTTLNTVSGIIKPLSGSIKFQGEELTVLAPHLIVARGLVQIPEGRRVFPFMTVKENLDLGAYLPGPRKHRQKNLEKVYGLLPILLNRRKQLAGSLSGGEQQMLAIGRSLMAEPRLLMLDEPTLGLAPMFVEKVFELILSIRNQGTTILLVEQNVQHALKIADYSYVIENGSLVLENTGEALLNDENLIKAYLGI